MPENKKQLTKFDVVNFKLFKSMMHLIYDVEQEFNHVTLSVQDIKERIPDIIEPQQQASFKQYLNNIIKADDNPLTSAFDIAKNNNIDIEKLDTDTLYDRRYQNDGVNDWDLEQLQSLLNILESKQFKTHYLVTQVIDYDPDNFEEGAGRIEQFPLAVFKTLIAAQKYCQINVDPNVSINSIDQTEFGDFKITPVVFHPDNNYDIHKLPNYQSSERN